MSRTGKIARLPKAVRDQLNKNLTDGVSGVRLVDWLNSLPEVQQVLTDQFDGRGINEVNLSEWKAGGYLDWQARREMLESAKELAEEGQDIQASLEGLTKHLGTVVAARYAQLLNDWNGEVDEGFMKKLKALRLLCHDVAVLRRADLKAERLELEKKQFENAQRCDEAKSLEFCLSESKEYPEVAEAFQQVFRLQREYMEGKRKNETYLAQEQKRWEEAEEISRKAYFEKRRLEDEAKEKEQQEQAARIQARKDRWSAAHPGQDPQAGKWWAWVPEEAMVESE
ncbi:MAG TPA: hypothetical protein VG347_15055 [Verrucomicrobiae bacterium]|nr:hypothetical protein [Verrucomicrobiae bacterium]